MAEFNTRKLAAQLDAVQSILDEIRITSGCEALEPSVRTRSMRDKTALEAAKRALRDRQRRPHYLGEGEIFGEPAWDILLDLFIKQAEDEQASIASACAHAHMSPATGLRWLRLLEQHGLVLMTADTGDDTRDRIRLTPAGFEGMMRYLTSIAQ